MAYLTVLALPSSFDCILVCHKQGQGETSRPQLFIVLTSMPYGQVTVLVDGSLIACLYAVFEHTLI